MEFGKNYGPEKYIYFWFQRPHQFEFRTEIKTEIFCAFDFSHFPFDTNSCNFSIGSISHSHSYVLLSPTMAINGDRFINKIGDTLDIHQKRLPFDIQIEIYKPFTVFEDGYDYSFAGFTLHFKRSDLGTLVGGFYFPTGSFSLLSLLSYSIHYENVSKIIINSKTISYVAFN